MRRRDLVGRRVEVVDVKQRKDLDLVGRRGLVKHDRVFGNDYLSFDDGGSAELDHLILEVRK